MTRMPNPAPERLRPDGRGGVVILCDHASNHIPPELNGLGLDPACLETHIAVDIGAAEVARRLSERLDAPAILAPVSRLAVDLNRNPATQDPVPAESDGIVIPGNQGLTDAMRAERLERWFHPYHAACAAQVASMMAQGERPVVIGLHSFTPRMEGEARPWEIGFLYDRDPRLFRAFHARLSEIWDFTIGDNEPYSGRELYYTMQRHGEAHGLLQATVELRQDLIADAAGQDRWAGILEACLKKIRQSNDLQIE